MTLLRYSYLGLASKLIDRINIRSETISLSHLREGSQNTQREVIQPSSANVTTVVDNDACQNCSSNQMVKAP
jgi:hypothetical protein